MMSHDKHNISLPEEGLPLMEKTSQIAPNDTVVAKREDGRRHPARRLFLAFLICSSMLFALASVHSPSFRQRFSCHNGMMGNVKLGVEGEGEAQPSTLTAMMEKEGPQASNESVDLSVPNQLEENHQEGGDVYHAAAAPKATKLRLLRRETNSSSVAPESSATARTADPDPTSTPTASSSEPSSTAESPTSSASPTPSSPMSSTFKTLTTTPTTSPQTSTTKVPDPTTSSSSSSTPEPPNTGVNVTPSKTSSVESTSSVTSSSTSSRGQATTTTASVDDEDDGNGDGDDVTHDTTIYTTRPANPTAPPPTTPKVIIETSTRTSNGQVVIVESTFTVQPSITQPASVTDPARPPASLQNSATRQEGGGMVLARLMAGAVMVVLLY